MPVHLHTRLALILLLLLIPTASLFVLSTLITSRRYYNEITQKVEADLARRLVSETNMAVEKAIETKMLGDIASILAAIEPAEMYVLDITGHIIGASDPDNIVLKRVDLTPIQQVLGGHESYPVLGTDPKKSGAKGIFSVSPIPLKGEPEGYLYLLINDEDHQPIVRMAQGSVALRAGIVGGLSSLVLVFALGMLLFRMLTQRLNSLCKQMDDFAQSNFSSTTQDPEQVRGRDEIAQLERIYLLMAHRIKEQIQELKQVDTLRRELITNVSHDLRTPLTSLRGYLETLHLKADTLTVSETQHYRELALKSTQRLGKLIGELFELSKLDAQQVQPHFESFSVADLIHDTLQKMAIQIQHKEIALSADIPQQMPLLHGDIGLIDRALTNLIDNAVKYTPFQGYVVVWASCLQNHIRISIYNNGEGIPTAELPYVFERFYRAQRVGDKQEGSGLGLAITKRIITLHKGDISVRSGEEGTQFTILLPLRP